MTLPLYCIVEGRRPEGLVAPPHAPLTPVVGDYLARVAYFEIASAIAFDRLHRELAAYDAPATLVAACEAARGAELDHGKRLARLAARFGGRACMPKRRPLPTRPLLEVAIENVVEGVVRGTYGAAVAHLCGTRAADPEIREAYRAIARDEHEHADLAFDLATWLSIALDPVERVLVEDAQRHAVTALAHELDLEPHPTLCDDAGVPSRLDALAIWSALSHRVWHGTSDCEWLAAA